MVKPDYPVKLLQNELNKLIERKKTYHRVLRRKPREDNGGTWMHEKMREYRNNDSEIIVLLRKAIKKLSE